MLAVDGGTDDVGRFSGRSMLTAEDGEDGRWRLLIESTANFNCLDSRSKLMPHLTGVFCCWWLLSDPSGGLASRGSVAKEADVFPAPDAEWSGDCAVCCWRFAANFCVDVSPENTNSSTHYH